MKKLFFFVVFSFLANAAFAENKKILHVSYDPTREFYEEYNAVFIKSWLAKTGQDISVRQSHGGSGKQARAVIDGLKADFVSLALAYDIDAIAQKTDLIQKNWAENLPNKSVPMYSTIVLLVRKTNPKAIKDWGDIVKPGVEVITPNPKTSGGARWNYLAAYAYALKLNNGDKAKAEEFVSALYKNVKVLDTGARGSTMTFVQRNIGDVLITWENEAYLAKEQLGAGKFEVIYPSLTIKADTPVAVVTKNTEKSGTKEISEAYALGLFEKNAQELLAKHFFRPIDPDVLAKHQKTFPHINAISIDDLGGWENIHKEHFSDGGIFDKIYGKK